MFERRLKIFMVLLFIVGAVLLGRCAHMQLIGRADWDALAKKAMKRSTLLDTQRGSIRDIKGRVLAEDVGCTDAAVDYRAIIRDPEWIKAQAIERLKNRDEYPKDRSARAQAVADEIVRVNDDLTLLWKELARVSGKSDEEIAQIREGILTRVKLRQRAVWYEKYSKALRDRGAGRDPAWYKRWLMGDEDDAPDLESFDVFVGEETETHSVLKAINKDDAMFATLEKASARFPGLVLKQGTTRNYPMGNICCHLLGQLSLVSREDLQMDPYSPDDLRHYQPNDLIGRTGIEELAESILHGAHGRHEYSLDDSAGTDIPAVPGRDATITIDLDLQAQIQKFFEHVSVPSDSAPEERQNLHGAAVVIDVASGEVRALVSNPTFDLNRFEQDYNKLAFDEIDQPMRNRATMSAFEPGSTVKTIMASGAITDGVLLPTDTIECTGFLILKGHKYSFGRCWGARMYPNDKYYHHGIPYDAPHPTGFLTATDALERSCNVFYETTAWRMGIDRVRKWDDKFGLGRPTGIGIAEAWGRIPDPSDITPGNLLWTTCFAGIGQGEVAATPIQMANVAATIARDGVWLRPHLLPFGPDYPEKSEDRVDLQLKPEAVKAVKDGMIRVVNDPKDLSKPNPAGTGTGLHRDDIVVAGKTGSAQASILTVVQRDAQGNLLRDASGNVLRVKYEPGAFDWYHGVGAEHEDLAHAWVIGFAPADHPKVAFCVMVEYGGSGGRVAAAIGKELLDACVEHGYLP